MPAAVSQIGIAHGAASVHSASCDTDEVHSRSNGLWIFARESEVKDICRLTAARQDYRRLHVQRLAPAERLDTSSIRADRSNGIGKRT